MESKSDSHRQHLAQCSIEQAPEGVFWVNPAGFFLKVNLRFCEQLGYSEDELPALHICDLVTDWSKSQWPERWLQLRRQHLIYYEGGLTTRLGDVVDVEISACLLRYGNDELMCGFVRESVRRHKGAEALIADLKKSVDRFRILYNNAPVMLQACDFETRIFSVNQYWLQTMGYQWREVMGRQTLEFMTEATRNDVNCKVLPKLRMDRAPRRSARARCRSRSAVRLFK